MSELGLARVPKVRPARVWQPFELARSTSLQQGFTKPPWALPSSSCFWPQEVPVDLAEQRILPPPEHTGMPEEMAAPHPAAGQIDEVAIPSGAGPSEELLESVRAKAYAQGAFDTRTSLQAEMIATLEAERAQDQSLVDSLQEALGQLQRQPQEYFEPLKRLALHLAEQLVLAELSVDAKAIERIVQRCVDELSSHDESMIVVELSPVDLPRFEALRQRMGLNRDQSLKLKANPSLLPGSARASANDAIVEDLIEHRLEEFARSLGVDESRWKAASAFDHGNLADRGGAGLRGVEDALPRMAASVSAMEATFLGDMTPKDGSDD